MFRCLILLGAVLALHRPSAGLAQGAPTVAQVGWIAGCWEQKAGARLIEEQWMRPRAGLMLVVGITFALAKDASMLVQADLRDVGEVRDQGVHQ